MTKRKIISVLLIAVVLCSVCLLVAGCPADDTENKKYNVAMKIVCKEVVNGKTTGPILGEWIFDKGVSELHIERQYDGKKYNYYLYSFCLYDDPLHPDIWISPSGADRFSQYLGMVGQHVDEPDPEYVCEVGSYCLLVEASNRGTLWNRRRVCLYIDVK